MMRKLKQLKIMKLIFQPLVENAVYHGINEAGRFRHIRVKIAADCQRLRITVSDTGQGMRKECLMEPRETLTSAEPHWALQYCERLQLTYGGNQPLSYAANTAGLRP